MFTYACNVRTPTAPTSVASRVVVTVTSEAATKVTVRSGDAYSFESITLSSSESIHDCTVTDPAAVAAKRRVESTPTSLLSAVSTM